MGLGRKAKLALAAAALGGLCACTSSKNETPAAQPMPVRVRKAEMAAVGAEQKRYAAVIQPESQVVLAFRTGGVVTYLAEHNGRALEPGDQVAAGTVLARLRTTEYQARSEAAGAQVTEAGAGVTAAKAAVNEAQAALRQANDDLTRAQALFNVKALTKSDLDGARARRDGVQARYDQAQANVLAMQAKQQEGVGMRTQSDVALADSVIRAPFTGSIVMRQIERGSSAGPGTPAYVMADLRRVKVVFSAGDNAVVHLRPGAPVQISVEALSGRTFGGHIIAVSAVADPTTRAFPVTAVAANTGGVLKGGMVASVMTGESNSVQAVTVPLRAVRRWNDAMPDAFAVFVLKDGKAHLQRVTLGAASGAMVAIPSGLAVGEMVVEDAGAGLNDGDAVTVLQ